jgi:integrase
MPKYTNVYYKKENKRWYYYFNHKRKRYTDGGGFDTAKDAYEAMERRRAEVKRGIGLDDAVSFRDFTIQYLNHKKMHVRKSTLYQAELHVRLHLLPELESIKLRDIKPVHVQKLQDKLMGDMAPMTVRAIMLTLRRILKWAVDLDIIDRNPAVKVQPPRAEKELKTIPLTAEQSKYLLDNSPIRERTAIALGALAGLRIGEVFGLQWDDIMDDFSTLTVRRQYSQGVLSEPKTKSSMSPLPILPELQMILKEYRMASKSKRWLFPARSYMDQPRQAEQWRVNYFTPLLKELKLPKVRFHDLRHTYASLLLASGMSPKDVQIITRHSSLATLDIYAHEVPNHIREFASKLKFLSGYDSDEISNAGQ